MTAGEPLIRWDWIASHVPQIAERLGEHLVLTGIAIGFGLIIASGLSFVALRRPWSFQPITWVTGTMYTIPSLGLFALLIPFTGLSVVTAEIGLVSYTLLILVRNIVTGIRSVPSEIREAAIAMGYTGSGLLLRVEMPLALPAIVAGLRIATVTTVGLVTVTAIIGLGGLGGLIYDGYILGFATPLIVGAVLSLALAILADAGLAVLQRGVTPWARSS